MVVRTASAIILTGPAVSAPGGDPIPKGRRADTKHVYLPGFGGAQRVRADVNEDMPLPVYGQPAETTMQEGGMFAKSTLKASPIVLSQDYDSSRPE